MPCQFSRNSIQQTSQFFYVWLWIIQDAGMLPVSLTVYRDLRIPARAVEIPGRWCLCWRPIMYSETSWWPPADIHSILHV